MRVSYEVKLFAYIKIVKLTSGDIVYYGIRFEEKISKRTMIKFLTDGKLLREAILDSKFKIVWSHYSG